jgi:hypothetical protein
MSELLTLDLETPAFPSPDDESSDAMIKRAERRARSIQRVVTRRAEVRLAEAAVYFDDMDLEEQAEYGKISKYFFRNKHLPKSHMTKLGKMVEKYNGGEKCGS